MRLENQVCTQSQAARLKELGVVQNGVYSWLWNKLHKQHMLSHHTVEALELMAKSNPEDRNWSIRIEKGICSAFTVAELGCLLPKSLGLIDGRHWGFYHRHCWKGESVGYSAYGAPSIVQEWYDNEAISRADMVIKLLETKLATIEEVNSKIK